MRDGISLTTVVKDWGYTGKNDFRKIEFILAFKGNIVGMADMYYYLDDEPDKVVLSSLWILGKQRGKGYGEYLQKEREKYAIQTLKRNHIFLFVVRGTWMYQWYKRRGYKFYKRMKDGNSNSWLHKTIDN